MVSIVKTYSLEGVTVHPVSIECDITNGLPSMTIIGLTQKSAEGVKERVRASILNSGLEFPRKRITINLAPADLPKDGSLYDLPIAVAILARSGQIESTSLKDTRLIGELGLEGNLRPVRGILAIGAYCKARGYKLIAPAANSKQLELIQGLTYRSAHSLRNEYKNIIENAPLRLVTHSTAALSPTTTESSLDVDLSDVIGQEKAKRALEIASAGGHNILMSGPPGTGKSMLAKAFAGILPEMTKSEIIESTQLHSLANNNYDDIIDSRPFRSPHHSASHISLVGGGQYPRPGEISLAHNGVLFLDEFPEFAKVAIESLRQPLEDGFISIARANRTLNLPANFILVATCNPCPCGYLGDTKKACHCSLSDVVRYRKKLSGPILDRIDLQIHVDRVETSDILNTQQAEPSSVVKKRVESARAIQRRRLPSSSPTNSQLSSQYIRKHFKLSSEVVSILDLATDKFHLSSRSYFRTIKIARTIADLGGDTNINTSHMAEALQFRLDEAPLTINA